MIDANKTTTPPAPPLPKKEPLKGTVPDGKSIYFAGKKLKAGDKIPATIEKMVNGKPPTKKP